MTKKEILQNKEIHSDYSLVNNLIEEILKGDKINYFVMDPDFLCPSCVMPKVIPFDDVDGELQYYIRIRSVLEIALMTGSIPKDRLPQRAPDYLKELVE